MQRIRSRAGHGHRQARGSRSDAKRREARHRSRPRSPKTDADAFDDDVSIPRLATCALLTVLAMEYREWYRACVALAALDVAAHWFHVYVSVFIGSDGHKDLAPNSNWLLKTYYTNRIFMGVCCTSVEVLYLCAHARRAAPNFAPTFFSFFLRAAVPGFMIKQIANLTQLRDACKTLMKIDVVEM